MRRFVVFFFDGSNEVTSLFFAINTLGMTDLLGLDRPL